LIRIAIFLSKMLDFRQRSSALQVAAHNESQFPGEEESRFIEQQSIHPNFQQLSPGIHIYTSEAIACEPNLLAGVRVPGA
jgi:hypothetical protein